MNLHNAEFVRSVTAVADCPKDGLPQIAFAGKSNVGKSSVINKLLQLARLRGMEQADWARTAHGSEGLWSKVWKAVLSQPDYESILAAAKSKRYPRTRLQRLLLCAYLGISEETLRQTPPYVRVLAFDERGQTVLRQAKKSGGCMLVNAGQTPPDAAYYELERRAADLYTLFSRPGAPCSAGTERGTRIYQRKP